jgi:hypothetical protein
MEQSVWIYKLVIIQAGDMGLYKTTSDALIALTKLNRQYDRTEAQGLALAVYNGDRMIAYINPVPVFFYT